VHAEEIGHVRVVNSNTLASADVTKIKYWNFDLSEIATISNGENIFDLEALNDGTTIIGSNSGEVRFYRNTRTSLGPIDQAVTAVCQLSNGDIVAGYSGGKLIRWSMSTNSIEREYETNSGSRTNDIKPLSGNSFLTVSEGYTSIKRWNAATSQPEIPLGIRTGQVMEILSDPLLAVGLSDKKLEIYNTNNRQLVRELTGHVDSIIDMRFMPSSSHLVGVSKDKKLFIWNINDGTIIRSITYAVEPKCLEIFTCNFFLFFSLKL
jgi:WD40 repeat protein